MGMVTTPGFYGGRFHQGGQDADAAGEGLDALTKAELLQRAKDRGVTIADSATKAEIVAALQAA